MAGNKKNQRKSAGTSGARMGSNRSSAAKKRTGSAAKPESGFQFQNEVVLLAVLAASLILFLGNFGLAGNVGTWLSIHLRGLIGVMAYLFPVVLFVSACFCLIRKSGQTYKKTAVVYLMMLMGAAMVQVLRGKQFLDGVKLGRLFEQGTEQILTGGLFGGGIARLLYSILGMLGAMTVLILIMLGCIIYLAEVSFVHGVEKQSKRVYENTKEDMRRRREIYEERSRQRTEEKQQERILQEEDARRVRRQERPTPEEEEMRRRRKEEERRRQRAKKEKIARQKAYMEQDMREREARAQQYEKKEYVNANGMSPVTLEQPKQYKKMDDSRIDVHEIFDEGGEKMTAEAVSYAADSWNQGAFTIQRDGEVSEIQVDGDVISKTVTEKETAQPVDVQPAEHVESQKEAKVLESMDVQEPVRKIPDTYEKPPLSLLKRSGRTEMQSDEALTQTGMKLQQTLQSFGVRVTVTNISCGPTVTRFELQPEQGVKVSKIVGLADDIKLNLAVSDIRIEAPIPGKAAVGIEVPNARRNPVLLGDLIASKEFNDSKSLLSFAVGKDIGGNVIVHDVAKMPHLLVAGATGAGKSVCSNTLIMSILYKADPEQVKLIMIDPKVVELSIYNGIPHMLIPVVTDPKKAAGALNWAVSEMSERYNKMAVMGVRDVKSYNEKLKKIPDSDEKPAFLPQIVIIVDELADLMMVAKNEVEDAICRLAQLARAAGIHLIIATQRPSVDVITGLIKANMPSRIALSVSSGVDSRTIIDMNGAEKLLGMGDMLFYPSGYPKPVRVQGAFISDDEVHNVVDYLRSQGKRAEYNTDIEEKINQMQRVTADAVSTGAAEGSGSMYDEYFAEAGKFVIEKDKGSIGMLQRMFRIGFNRAARIMDQLEEAGVVGAEEGTKPRKVLMSLEQFEQFVEESV